MCCSTTHICINMFPKQCVGTGVSSMDRFCDSCTHMKDQVSYLIYKLQGNCWIGSGEMFFPGIFPFLETFVFFLRFQGECDKPVVIFLSGQGKYFVNDNRSGLYSSIRTICNLLTITFILYSTVTTDRFWNSFFSRMLGRI